MSTKKHPTIYKHWLTTGSVAFVASCGCSLPFTQNLAQSMLVGVAAIPGIVANTLVRSRQRQQQLNRQLKRGRLRLHQLHQRGAILNDRLQLQCQERQTIELKIAQLHNLAASLTDRLDRDRTQHQQLEQQLAALATHEREQQHLAEKLDRKIQDRQAEIQKLDIDLNQLKLECSHLKVTQIQTQTAHDRAKISLQDIQIQIDRCLATKQELELNIQQLQSQKVIDDGDFDESIEQKHSLLHKLDTAISERLKMQQQIAGQVDRLEQTIAQRTPELVEREQQLSAIESTIQTKQAQLEQVAAALVARQDEIASSPADLAEKLHQRELKTAQLELSSRQAELDNLELKIQAKLQELDAIDLATTLQTFAPKPPLVDRDLDRIAIAGAWHDRFIDNPHLPVLQHIEKHGTITEAEASTKLGNARSVRQFANKLEEYAQDLPFAIRVESSPKGNRYIKELQD